MKSEIVEQCLRQGQVEFEYLESVPLAQIDKRSSLQNQARTRMPDAAVGIIKDLVDSYVVDKKAGCRFPALVGRMPREGSKYILMDGNQRLLASEEAGEKTTDLYWVKSDDPSTIARLTWTLNNLNGERLTPEECLEHAASFVEQFNCKLADAAAEWKVGVRTLRRHLDLRCLYRILEGKRVKITKALTPDMILRAAALRAMGEDLFVKACRLIAEYGLNAADLDDLLQRIRLAETAAAKEQILHDYAHSDGAKKRRAQTKGGKVSFRAGSARQQHWKALNKLYRLYAKHHTDVLIQPSEEDWEEGARMADMIRSRLNGMFGPLPGSNSEAG